ncbi:hypothetical protein [Sphingomonas panacis]|uniref:hypothetical protein n=1 Tax=Sphingomonas panacis TaxID=1560345 RepID=UPI0012373C50|nr:hypothetical protein [Sphingomonas panacis]
MLVVHPSFVGADITLANDPTLSGSDSEDYPAFGNVTAYFGDTTASSIGLAAPETCHVAR